MAKRRKQDDQGQAWEDAFIPTARAFLEVAMHATLGPGPVKEMFGDTIDEAARKMVTGAASQVRGNRGDHVRLTPEDYRLMLDQLVEYYQIFRHGPDGTKP